MSDIAGRYTTIGVHRNARALLDHGGPGRRRRHQTKLLCFLGHAV